MIQASLGAQSPHPARIVPNRPAAGGIATALVLMGLFTELWSAWGFALGRGWLLVPTIVCWAVAMFFFLQASQLFRVLPQLPLAPGTAGQAGQSGRAPGQRFGVLFGVEIGVIVIACIVLGVTSLEAYLAPVVSIVVGAHFIPMVRLFGRPADFWLGIVLTALGAAGMVLIAIGALPAATGGVIVCFATACVVIAYGFVMTSAKRSALPKR